MLNVPELWVQPETQQNGYFKLFIDTSFFSLEPVGETSDQTFRQAGSILEQKRDKVEGRWAWEGWELGSSLG